MEHSNLRELLIAEIQILSLGYFHYNFLKIQPWSDLVAIKEKLYKGDK